MYCVYIAFHNYQYKDTTLTILFILALWVHTKNVLQMDPTIVF